MCYHSREKKSKASLTSAFADRGFSFIYILFASPAAHEFMLSLVKVEDESESEIGLLVDPNHHSTQMNCSYLEYLI